MLPAIVCISSHVSRSLLNTLVQSYLRGLLPTLVSFISLIVLVSRFLPYLLHSARDNTTPSAIEHKSRLRYFLFIKALAVVGLVTANVTAFALEAYGSRQNLWTLAELITWLYVLVLAILQVVLSASCRRTLELWNHLTAIYAVQCVFKLILLWSAIVHPQLIQPQTLTIAECFLTSLLFFIAVTTQNNNAEVSLPQEEDLELSKEPLASLLSKSTFCWGLSSSSERIWKGSARRRCMGPRTKGQGTSYTCRLPAIKDDCKAPVASGLFLPL